MMFRYKKIQQQQMQLEKDSQRGPGNLKKKKRSRATKRGRHEAALFSTLLYLSLITYAYSRKEKGSKRVNYITTQAWDL